MHTHVHIHSTYVDRKELQAHRLQARSVSRQRLTGGAVPACSVAAGRGARQQLQGSHGGGPFRDP